MYREDDRLATPSEACREWAWNVGQEPRYADQQWLLTDYDTWERNPHYHGPAQEHPYDAEARAEAEMEESQSGFEDFEYRERCKLSAQLAVYEAQKVLDDDIPF